MATKLALPAVDKDVGRHKIQELIVTKDSRRRFSWTAPEYKKWSAWLHTEDKVKRAHRIRLLHHRPRDQKRRQVDHRPAVAWNRIWRNGPLIAMSDI